MGIGKKNIVWLILAILLTIPVFWKLARPGFFPMQDDLQAFRIYEMDKCFDDIQIPCRWVPDAGYRYGYPQFNYYPPSVYYVGAIIHRMGIQYIDAVKIIFIAGYIVSAVTMFMLVNSIWGSWPAFVSSVLYTYVPYKAVEVYVRGAMSEFWALSLFPLVFWAVYKLIRTGKKKYFIWFSVSIALLATTHSLMTLIFAPVAVAWAIYWIWRKKKWKNIKNVIFSGLLGVGLASYFLLPMILEKKFVHVESMLSGYFDYRAHFVSLYKLFVSREWGYGSSGFPNELLNLSVGTIQWIIGIFALALGLYFRKRKKSTSTLILVLGGIELLVLFMMHMKSSFIWARLPALWWLQFPWRFMSVSVFLLSVLAGGFIYILPKAKYIIGVVAVTLAVFINMGFFIPKDWLIISDTDKFTGIPWEKQMTISIFDYLPIYAVLPPTSEAPKTPEVMDGEATFVDYEKGSNYQVGNVVVESDATIRLPIYDFPGMKVWVNNELITHNHDECRGQEYCLGLVSFKLQKGNYYIKVKLTDTPTRRVSNYITLTGIVIVIYMIVKKDEKDNK